MRRITALCTFSFLLAACGGSGATTSDTVVNGEDLAATLAPAPVDSAAPDVIATPDTVANGEPAAPVDPGSATAPAPATSESTGGTCTASMTGGATANFSGGGGMFAVNSAHWFSAEELQKAKDDFGFDTPALVLNCQGPNGELVTLSKSDVTTFPYAPGEVVFETSEISASLDDGVGTYVKPAAPVTVTLTAFDDTKIAGSASFDALNALNADGTLTRVELTFDFTNPNP